MRRDDVVNTVKENMEKIKSFGVKRVGIFGSVSRDEADENSDIDFVVEFEKGKATLSNFTGLTDFLEDLFQRDVDILTPRGVESIRIKSVKERIKREILYV